VSCCIANNSFWSPLSTSTVKFPDISPDSLLHSNPSFVNCHPVQACIFASVTSTLGWHGVGLRRRRARVQIAVMMLSGNSLRQTVHTHCASVHQAAKLVAALLRVAGVTVGLAESNGSLLPGL